MAGQDGDKPPKSTAKSFSNARDGKETEPDSGPHYTKQEYAAAERLVEANAKPESRGKAADMKAAEGRFDFNKEAQDKPQAKPTQHEKPTKSEHYQSKTDGKTYTDQKAVAAAKAIDKTEAEKAAAAAKERTTHHAPAPKPSYASSNPKRGVSISNKPGPAKSEEQVRKDAAKENRMALAADMAAKNAQKKDQAKSKEQNQDKGMGR